MLAESAADRLQRIDRRFLTEHRLQSLRRRTERLLHAKILREFLVQVGKLPGRQLQPRVDRPQDDLLLRTGRIDVSVKRVLSKDRSQVSRDRFRTPFELLAIGRRNSRAQIAVPLKLKVQVHCGSPDPYRLGQHVALDVVLAPAQVHCRPHIAIKFRSQFLQLQTALARIDRSDNHGTAASLHGSCFVLDRSKHPTEAVFC